MKLIYKTKLVGGDTSADYTILLNKPKLNGVNLVGNNTTEQAKITWYGTQAEYDALEAAGDVSQNTIYIIDDGAGVTTQDNYLDLNNKPSINGQMLTGNKTSGDLNMYSINEIDNMFSSMRSVKVVTSLPAVPVNNTMYYVGPDSEGYYNVYLYDSVGARIDMGTTNQSMYSGQNGISIDVNNVISLKNDADTVIVDTDGKVKVPTMTGATAIAKGHVGLVPEPAAGEHEKFLRGDGTWAEAKSYWVGTQTQYDALATKETDKLYIVKD